MTYNTNVPNTNQSPGRLPAQAAVNWTRLKEIIEANHLFSDTASTTEGFHQIVDWVKQTSAPAASGDGAQTYVQDADYRRDGTDITAPHIFHVPTDPADTNHFPVSVVPIRCYVVFDGTGAQSTNMTINSQYNVDTVARGVNIGSTRVYTINFANNLPSNKYAFSLSALGSSSNIYVNLTSDILNSSLTIRETGVSANYISVTIFGG